jgi:ring-1,2-phenylacetyl-CoA epoxidase subunit PaaD
VTTPAGPGAAGDERALVASVRAAVRGVDDPEFPGVSIEDLGILERVEVSGGVVEVDLLPTFVGCPALRYIEADVRAAAEGAAGGREVRVRFVHDPVWTPDRVTAEGRAALAREYTVAVAPAAGPVRCPRCGEAAAVERSPFGPTPCRSTWQCSSCREPVEVMRR